jgi:hypothetical protein
MYAYGTYWWSWPPGYDPIFGAAGFAEAAADMDSTTFAARFNEILATAGGDLLTTIETMAAEFADGMFFAQIGWEAADTFYQTVAFPPAPALAGLSSNLAQEAESSWLTYVDMLVAIYSAGGDLSGVGPYLEEVAAHLEQIVGGTELLAGELLSLRIADIASEDAPCILPRSLAPRCHPNPLFGSTDIFLGRKPGLGSDLLHIYDSAGRLVRTLRTEGSPGAAVVHWPGDDDQGRCVRPGVYFARDPQGNAVQMVKLK